MNKIFFSISLIIGLVITNLSLGFVQVLNNKLNVQGGNDIRVSMINSSNIYIEPLPYKDKISFIKPNFDNNILKYIAYSGDSL